LLNFIVNYDSAEIAAFKAMSFFAGCRTGCETKICASPMSQFTTNGCDLARLGWIGRNWKGRRLVAERPGQAVARRKITLLRPGRPHAEGDWPGFTTTHHDLVAFGWSRMAANPPSEGRAVRRYGI
jgi:hypothetical protein